MAEGGCRVGQDVKEKHIQRDYMLTSVARFDLVAIDAGLKHMETTCRLLQKFIKLQLFELRQELFMLPAAIRDLDLRHSAGTSIITTSTTTIMLLSVFSGFTCFTRFSSCKTFSMSRCTTVPLRPFHCVALQTLQVGKFTFFLKEIARIPFTSAASLI